MLRTFITIITDLKQHCSKLCIRIHSNSNISKYSSLPISEFAGYRVTVLHFNSITISSYRLSLFFYLQPNTKLCLCLTPLTLLYRSRFFQIFLVLLFFLLLLSIPYRLVYYKPTMYVILFCFYNICSFFCIII